MNLNAQKEFMIKEHLVKRGIRDKRVIEAFRKVNRELFIPPSLKKHSYDDNPLPIGEGQTISQPYIVAYMIEKLQLTPDDKVLEIGTGSGYQTALLAEIVKEVYTVEMKETLLLKAKKILNTLGYKNIHFKIGDGKEGWKEYSPYNKIVVSAAPLEIPDALIEQLANEGKMIIPAGGFMQYLYLIHKDKNGRIKKEKTLPVSFVPLL